LGLTRTLALVLGVKVDDTSDVFADELNDLEGISLTVFCAEHVSRATTMLRLDDESDKIGRVSDEAETVPRPKLPSSAT
jgi:uncharacterized protein YwlG (UPF0340 family)